MSPCQIKYAHVRSEGECYTYHRWHQNIYEVGVNTGVQGDFGFPRGSNILTNVELCVPCDVAEDLIPDVGQL